VVADLSMPPPFRRRFAAVLVDAPCSGLGTVRRRPELKWRNSPERLRRLARLQGAILDNAARVLAPAGALLYVTCSTEPQENEEVVADVVRRRDDLELRPVELPAGVDGAFVGSDGFFRTYPHEPDLDGFFAALLVKRRGARGVIEHGARVL
jgi:16S rRNA (cytosine967-C5)-methyltransferase